MERELHLNELFKVIYKFFAVEKNWILLSEYPAQQLLTDLIFFFIANGSPKKLSGSTFSLEDWMGGKKRLLGWEEKQTIKT